MAGITQCRICKNKNLLPLIHLGEQTLTGIFPKSKNEKISSGPLELVKCHSDDSTQKVCNLVQLGNSFNGSEMYGLNYGYRSGLNLMMVEHLQNLVNYVISVVKPENGDLIIDIGSNDATLLKSYPSEKKLTLAGIDPTGIKFKNYYPEHIKLIPDFFSETDIKNIFPLKKAKIITSVAMFYDLEEPIEFVKQVHNILDEDGIWVLEQSYLPSMLARNAYDTICHEHIEYYSLEQIRWIMDEAGFKLIDVSLNDCNGGSFRVTVAKNGSAHKVRASVDEVRIAEEKLNLSSLQPFDFFLKNIKTSKENICSLIREINARGEKIFGYGASTKGNVILQYCGLTQKDINFIAEVNEDKVGSYTPFTHIPIISEAEARKLNPDYFLVLPWHFKKGILEKEKDYIRSGGKMIFPLPELEIIGK